MARTELTRTITTRDGVAGTYAAFNTGDGNYFENNQNSMLHVVNADAAAHVIHIITQSTDDGKAVKDRLISVPAGASRFIGPFPNATYGSSGQVQVDCYDASGPTFNATTDAVSGGTKDSTGVTVAVVQVGSLGT